jgi:hypothetical protein
VKDGEVMEMIGLLMSREGKVFLLSGVAEDVYLTCLSQVLGRSVDVAD